MLVMQFRFTQHAEDKFEILERHDVNITKSRVIKVLKNPEHVDKDSRKPLIIAQSTLDENRVLRVVYKEERGTMVVITFYPGRKSQYEC